MKRIITPKVNEEAEYYCDKHSNRRCYSDLKTRSWYGSHFDMLGVEVRLCDECVEEFFKFIEKQFGIKPVESEMI